jgi:hypothetical protein
MGHGRERLVASHEPGAPFHPANARDPFIAGGGGQGTALCSLCCAVLGPGELSSHLTAEGEGSHRELVAGLQSLGVRGLLRARDTGTRLGDRYRLLCSEMGAMYTCYARTCSIHILAHC